jgi:plastocyanin
VPRPLRLLAAASLAALAAPAAAQAAPTLVASVGPTPVISLTTDGTTPVTSLDPGTYTIVVHDRSPNHDFHLTGAGVDQATPVPFTGDVSWTVTLQPGQTYTFVCDPHRAFMKGSFTTLADAPKATLNATVGAGFTIGLTTEQGAPVHEIDPGRYQIAVDDRADIHDFHLTGDGLDLATGVPFVGTTVWSVTLLEGHRYHFFCDPHSGTMFGDVYAVGPLAGRLLAPTTGHVKGLRSVAVRVSANRSTSVRAQLRQGSKVLRTTTFKASLGEATGRLTVPRALPAGRYTLRVQLTDSTGAVLTRTKVVRLPAR